MLLAAPIFIPWAGAAAIALADGRSRRTGVAALAVLVVALAAALALAIVVLVDGSRQTVAGDWAPGIGIVLRADALGAVFAALSLAVLLAALGHEVATGVRSRSFPALVLFLAAGLTGLFLTGDVFNFYVFFELSMIASYVLAGYGYDRPQVAGSFIFAVVNLIGSFIFLSGIAAMYHVTGTLEMEATAERLGGAEPAATLLIAISVFIAFGVKLGLFPFHFWLPAVYTGARPAVAAILSGALANIGAYGLLRFGGELLDAQLRLGSTALIALGVTSIVYGAVQAVARRATAEVLAYSAIGQAGYILVALGVGGPVGFSAAVLYAVVNSLNKTLLFLAGGLRGPLVGGAFAIGALSVAGVPPSAGFLGKAVLFDAGIDEGSVALVALIFLGGALSFVYMLQIYQHDFWRGERRADERAHGWEPDEAPDSAAARTPLAVTAVLVLALGLWPEALLSVSDEAGGVLAGGAP